MGHSVMCNREWTTITPNALQPISCKQAARKRQTQYRIKVGSTDAAALGPFKKQTQGNGREKLLRPTRVHIKNGISIVQTLYQSQPNFIYPDVSISMRDLTKVSDRDRNVKVNKVWL